jgi:hypothetical protein
MLVSKMCGSSQSFIVRFLNTNVFEKACGQLGELATMLRDSPKKKKMMSTQTMYVYRAYVLLMVIAIICIRESSLMKQVCVCCFVLRLRLCR